MLRCSPLTTAASFPTQGGSKRVWWWPQLILLDSVDYPMRCNMLRKRFTKSFDGFSIHKPLSSSSWESPSIQAKALVGLWGRCSTGWTRNDRGLFFLSLFRSPSIANPSRRSLDQSKFVVLLVCSSPPFGAHTVRASCAHGGIQRVARSKMADSTPAAPSVI
jgi:hypothetical protein